MPVTRKGNKRVDRAVWWSLLAGRQDVSRIGAACAIRAEQVDGDLSQWRDGLSAMIDWISHLPISLEL